MAKRKVTVTIDEELLDVLRDQGTENVSAAINDALAEHAERVGRLAALRAQLDRWDAEFGVVGPGGFSSCTLSNSASEMLKCKPPSVARSIGVDAGLSMICGCCATQAAGASSAPSTTPINWSKSRTFKRHLRDNDSGSEGIAPSVIYGNAIMLNSRWRRPR